MGPPSICEQRSLRWEGETYTLPTISTVGELRRLGPRELDDRFWAIKTNRRRVVSEKVRSCLNTVYTTYINAAERQGFTTNGERLRLYDDFKNSSQWENVYQHHRQFAHQPRGAPPPPPPSSYAWDPPLAPKGPAASRDMNLNASNRNSETGPVERPSSSDAMKPPTRDPRRQGTPSSLLDNARLWKMPEPPTCEMREMTFQRFVDAFSKRNNIEPSKGFVPWDSILSTFKDYIQQYFPGVGEESTHNHVTYALERTKIRGQIPKALLEKHERRLRDEAPKAKSNGVNDKAKPANGTQQASTNPTGDVHKPVAGIAPVASRNNEALLGSKKRGRDSGGGSPTAPQAKQIKIESSPMGFEKYASFDAHTIANGPLAPRVPWKRVDGLSTDVSGDLRSHVPTSINTTVTRAFKEPSASSGGSPALLNPTLGPIRGAHETAGAVPPHVQEEFRIPSPVPSATTWLQNNPPYRQGNTPVPPDSFYPAAAPAVTLGGMMSPVIPGVPLSSINHGKLMRPMVKLDIIINGVLEELEGMTEKANQPYTANPLTAEQRHIISNMIYNHRAARKELGALQDALDGGS